MRVALVSLDVTFHLRELEVALQARHSEAHGFQIVAPPARSAGVKAQSGMTAAQFVPQREVVLHLKIFRDALPVLRVVLARGGQRPFAVHVLAIQIEAWGLDHGIKVVHKPVQRRRFADVKNRDEFKLPPTNKRCPDLVVNNWC